MQLGHRRRRRPARRAHRAAQGLRRARLASSTPTTTRPRARDLAANPYAAAVFAWLALERQVRISGPVAQVEPGRDRRLLRRPAARLAARRLGLARSRSSSPSRAALDELAAEVAARFADGTCRRRRTGAATGSRRRGRVLAGPHGPAARPAALPARRRRVGDRAARAVTEPARAERPPTAPTTDLDRRCSIRASRRGSCAVCAAGRHAVDTRPLAIAAYRRLLIGQGTAFIGSMLTQVAVPVQVYASRIRRC